MTPDRNPASEQPALATLDAFMAAFNRRDCRAVAAALNFPHVRLAGGRVAVFATADGFVRAREAVGTSALEAGWGRSAWDAREVIHSGADKVHLAVQFTRYAADGRPLASYRSLWIVILVDGHWGVQAPSSFAP